MARASSSTPKSCRRASPGDLVEAPAPALSDFRAGSGLPPQAPGLRRSPRPAPAARCCRGLLEVVERPASSPTTGCRYRPGRSAGAAISQPFGIGAQGRISSMPSKPGIIVAHDHVRQALGAARQALGRRWPRPPRNDPGTAASGACGGRRSSTSTNGRSRSFDAAVASMARRSRVLRARRRPGLRLRAAPRAATDRTRCLRPARFDRDAAAMPLHDLTYQRDRHRSRWPRRRPRSEEAVEHVRQRGRRDAAPGRARSPSHAVAAPSATSMRPRVAYFAVPIRLRGSARPGPVHVHVERRARLFGQRQRVAVAKHQRLLRSSVRRTSCASATCSRRNAIRPCSSRSPRRGSPRSAPARAARCRCASFQLLATRSGRASRRARSSIGPSTSVSGV